MNEIVLINPDGEAIRYEFTHISRQELIGEVLILHTFIDTKQDTYYINTRMFRIHIDYEVKE